MKTLAERIGYAAWEAMPEYIDSHYLTHSPRKAELVEQWGKELIETLRLQGIYVNEGRSDPSGRW